MRTRTTPGPGGLKSAAASVAMIRDPLAVYSWLNARYGDAVRCPLTPRHAIFLFARPEHAEHVLAVSQDNYVKAFTYRPLRAVIGDGLLTAEHESRRSVPLVTRRRSRAQQSGRYR